LTLESPPSVSEVCLPASHFSLPESSLLHHLTLPLPFVLQLIIPECGSLYCPWEQFKTIALSKINLDCIQEPLRATLTQLSSPSQSPGAYDDDDEALFASPMEILIITLLSVCSTLLAVGFILYAKGYRIALHSSGDSEEKGLIEVGNQKPANEV
jgi:hypothetical protein